MSWEAWVDDDDGFDAERLLDAGWWGPDDVDEVKSCVRALMAEPFYQGGFKASGVSVRFLMRLTLLQAAAGVDVSPAMVEEARRALGCNGTVRPPETGTAETDG